MKLHLQLLEARSLRPPDRTCNPYVCASLGRSKCKSAVSSSTVDASWFEDFVFHVDDLNAELEVSVWHQDRFADRFLGRLRLPVANVLSAERQTIPASWYLLQRRSKKSKTPVTGEIRLGLSLSGTLIHPSPDQSDLSTASSVNSTPDRSFLVESSSSDSFPSTGTGIRQDRGSVLAPTPEVGAQLASDKKTSSLLQHFSSWFSSKPSQSLSVPKTDQTESADKTADSLSIDSSDSGDEDETDVSPSFFEDNGVSTPASAEDLPAPLKGGILIDGTYAVSAKSLNAILFKRGSLFLQDLIDLQKTTNLVEGSWKKGEGGLPMRTLTYVKAPTKLVKSVKATEDQVYLRADEKGFVVNASASTPDVPYGTYFLMDLQYCIFAGADLLTGEKTSLLRISWGVNFLTSTMMKGLIENGARQGLQDSFKEFEQVLETYAKAYSTSSATGLGDSEAEAMLDAVTPKTDWQLAKEYFCNFRVCVTIVSLLAIMLHINLSRPCPKSGLEFWRVDFPDSLSELVTSAILGIQVGHVVQMARRFLRARLCRGSDHGLKAKGDDWLVSVILREAKNLSASNQSGVPDPYVVVTCSGKARTSSVKLQTSNPDWEERFEFDATEVPSTMDVEVFDFEGPFTEADSIGHVEINFLKQTPEELADLWVPLEGKIARAVGSMLHLRIVLMNSKEAEIEAHYIEKVEKEVGKISRRSLQKNVTFQKLFSLPSEEFLVNDFSCSLKRKVLLQGRLFLSPRVLAFYSNIFGHKTKFTLLWEDIDEIKETSPALRSVGMILNPAILVYTKKGRNIDAHHEAKSIDAKGRFKFQFQSFIRFKPALRTMTALWKYRTLSPEQQMEIIANMEQGDESTAAVDNQNDDCEMFLGVEEANLTEVYFTSLPLSVESMELTYMQENIEEKVAKKSGCLNYCTTPWESIGVDTVQQRRITYKLSNHISLFGTNVTCIQQKSLQEDKQAIFIDELLTLHDVPYGDNFQIRVRKELENTSSTPASSSCRVFVGVAWHKSTKFESRISKNIFERYTEYLKDTIDIATKEILEHSDENISLSQKQASVV